jgi:DNA-binding NtrC family response regulator
MSRAGLDLRGARILIVDDIPANLDVLCQSLEAAAYQVLVASTAGLALQLAVREVPDLILLDVRMPGMDGFEICRRLKQAPETREIPVMFLTGLGQTEGVVEGFEAGGVDYIVKPFHPKEVLVRVRTHLERARLAGELAAKNQQLTQANQELQEEVTRRRALTSERNHLVDQLSMISRREAEYWGIDGLVGESKSLQKVCEDIHLLQQADTITVLITGESGTGKELIARAFHAGSPRSRGPFVPVNCATIPAELAESLLFGHVKGAFTGAAREQKGYFELADSGTLFLDEIGDMPQELQAKLLRVLEDGKIMRLGATREVQVDVRILAATNADLQARMGAGTFRQDLYFRLARFAVQVPPLRQRREDIPLLARHFLGVFAAEMGIETPALVPAALEILEAHDYPGNVRELKNVIERALIESRGADIQPGHLHLGKAPTVVSAPGATPAGESVADLPLDFAQAETILIQRAVRQAKGNISEAARLLGINRHKVYRKLAQQEDGTEV